jgi:hypothetical protein
MNDEPAASSEKAIYRWGPLLALTATAVIVGVIARFKGLGKWPFTVDEYYLAQSVENLLRFGVPAYECGGYYTRGIGLQYVIAALRLIGLSPELAPRAVAAFSSLLVLPAAFLLGRRIQGAVVGLLVVTVLALSAWEIETARFGRMYGPFQAIFAWYLVFFVRYTIDRNKQALWGMLALTILGGLVWEGGVLLAVANLLPVFINHTRGRLTAAQWLYLFGTALLVPLLYWLAINDMRWAGDVPPLPPELFEARIAAAGSVFQQGGVFWENPASHPWWMLAGLPLLAAAGWALTWIVRFRGRWLAAVGLLVVLVAALAHQFLVALAVLGLLLLLRIIEWRELLTRAALPFWVTLAAAALLWTAFALATGAGGQNNSLGLPLLVDTFYQLFGFPNFLEVVARPWARGAPLFGLTLLLLLCVAAARSVLREQATPSAETALLVLIFAMFLLVSASDTPQTATRYVYFLFPAVVVVAIAALYRIGEALGRRPPTAVVLGALFVLSWFVLLEDFRPQHIWQIDSREANFKRNMTPGERAHFTGRDDARAVADWLTENANASTDLVISGQGVAALDFYYPNFDFVFLDPDDQRLLAWACQLGTVERWSNLPLVYSVDELRARIAASPRTFLVVDVRLLDSVLPDLEGLNPSVAWSNDYGNHTILSFEASVRP